MIENDNENKEEDIARGAMTDDDGDDDDEKALEIVKGEIVEEDDEDGKGKKDDELFRPPTIAGSEARFNELLAHAASLSGMRNDNEAIASRGSVAAPTPTKLRRRASSGFGVPAETPDLIASESAVEAELVTRHYESSPPFITGGELKSYQVAGLNWLIRRYDSGLSAILADEMGLGKTLESISLLAYLSAVRGIRGPFLVIAPKSTLHNWEMEFARWAPFMKVLKFHGDKETRARLRTESVVPGKFDVLLTSYEVAIIEKSSLHKHQWRHIVIDEAHRIKNENSILSRVVRWLHSDYRLLLTGTPLQNNLHELWALLNFLLPSVFNSSEDFDSWFKLEESDAAHQRETVEKLHRVLQPFMLRRLKADAAKNLPPKKEVKLFVGMTSMQTEWYRRVLTKDFSAITEASSSANTHASKMQLLNIIMQLRKVCNHPYLFDGAEVGHEDGSTGEDLVTSSGKMVVLDKLLRYLQNRGSRVLIFSQMTRMLDILEDYMTLRDYSYCRIDGQTAGAERDAQIDMFNATGSKVFAFLLSTRAGGLGINLATADTVVLYDSDWNPQVDLQAEDRVHRIGQQKPVTVYRFVTENSVEMKILQRAERKLQLDALVIQQGRLVDKAQRAGGASGEELLAMIRFGADDIVRATEGTLPQDEDIETILARGQEKTTALDAKIKSQAASLLKLDGSGEEQLIADKSSELDYLSWDGVNWREVRAEGTGEEHFEVKLRDMMMHMPKRDRPRSLSESVIWRMKHNIRNTSEHPAPQNLVVPRCPRAPKQPVVHDFQFYSPRYVELLAKERAAYVARKNAYDKKLEKEPEGGFQDLTEEEEAEKQQLSTQCFSTWNRFDFLRFVRGSEKYGRTDFAHITEEVGNKSVEEVKKYAETFWNRYNELKEGQRAIKAIERGEERIKKNERYLSALNDLMKSYTDPWSQLRSLPFRRGRTADVVFNDEEDCFILCAIHEYGLGNWDAIRRRIHQTPTFAMDWYMLSRSEGDLAIRGNLLLRLIERNPQRSTTPTKKDKEKDKSKSDKKGNQNQTTTTTTATSTTEEKPSQPPAKKPRQEQQTLDDLMTS